MSELTQLALNLGYCEEAQTYCSVAEERYEQGRADAIDEIKENIIPTLYEFDVMQDTIDFCVKWLEQLKEQNNVN